MTLIPSIFGATSLVASLPQTLTNGGSLLGTLAAQYLRPFLTDNPLPHGYPWGKRTAVGSSPHEDGPNTGVIRPYNFEISRYWISPDGVNRSATLINRQYPGPTIEANWGDTIQVTVTNKISEPEEGTSLHWHRILNLTECHQCPIAPNGTFTYSFRADVYGTGWYHSHYSAQYANGVFGPMIILGPTYAEYGYDVGPVMNNYFHYFAIIQNITGKITVPNSDNNLINGKMNFDCSVARGRECTHNAGILPLEISSGA